MRSRTFVSVSSSLDADESPEEESSVDILSQLFYFFEFK
jgi:hypothetical protein